MEIHPLHSWDLTAAEAVALQRRLAERIDVSQPLERCDLVAGVDISYNLYSDTLYAGVVVLRTVDWSIVETKGAVFETTFPYQTGLLSFREAPAMLEALAKVESEPDAIMVDGAGIAHPRRIGIASHLGLWLRRPCVGCAKSRLVGRFEEPARDKGAAVPLVDRGAVIGSVVRTKTGVKPVFVSAGHKIDLPSSVRLILDASRGYRLPEPTRQAHLFVNQLRTSH